jgi:methylated-DNA-protein-cysteine methyltransferase related protein
VAGSAAYARIKADVLAIVGKIPAGRLVTHGAIGRHLEVDPRHIVNVMTLLNDAERTRVPWWRVVANGGAIGRHALRDVQIRLLLADGVPIAPAGIAQDVTARAVTDFSRPASAIAPQASATGAKPSRSRGMKSHPAAVRK